MRILLNDITIRKKLKSYLRSLPVRPRAIVDELHVHKGNAIADVVAIYNEPHCFEIKGETDNISRLKKQGKFYDLVFKKITLITTQNHINNSLKTTPNHWGIIIAFTENDEIKFRHIRKSKSNPYICKELALLTLWKEEMLNIGELNQIELKKKLNKQELVSELSQKLSLRKVNTCIANSLLKRKVMYNH